MSSWMTCTTCKTVAINNETGVCLACQKGFTNVIQKDNYLYKEYNDYYPPEELKIWEKINAVEERIKQIDDKIEHKDGDKVRKIAEASCSDCSGNCT